MAKNKSNKSHANKKKKNIQKVNANNQIKVVKSEEEKVVTSKEQILNEQQNEEKQSALESEKVQEISRIEPEVQSEQVQQNIKIETESVDEDESFDKNQSDTYDEINEETDFEDTMKNIDESIQTSEAIETQPTKNEETAEIEQVEIQENDELESQQTEEVQVVQDKEPIVNGNVPTDISVNEEPMQDNFDELETNGVEQEEQIETSEKDTKLSFILPVKSDTKSEVIRKMFSLTSFVILIVCVVTLVVSTSKPKTKDETERECANPVEDFKPVSANKKYSKKNNKDYKKLYVTNSDTVGVLSLDETSIEEPVVQCKDNKFYKTHDFLKQKSKTGATYLDCTCKLDKHSKNIVIYRNKSNEIIDYERIETYQRKPLLTFKTLSQDKGRWKIYACFYTTVDKEDDNGYVFDYAYQKLNDSNFKGFIEEINRRRIYITKVEIKSSDPILMISVPANNDYFGNVVKKVNTRFVLVARKVRENESEVVTTSKTIYNKEVYKPQAYFDNTRTENRFLEIKKWKP